MQIRRINLFGGPNSGKSTLALGLVHLLKKKHKNVELVEEFVKKWAYESRVPKNFEQVYIFGQQMYKELTYLQNGVDTIVSDSPIFMNVSYALKNNFPSWKELLGVSDEFDKNYSTVNIVLQRREDTPYNQNGRFQNYDEACEMDDFIINCLISHNKSFYKGIFEPEDVIQLLEEELGWK